MSKEIVVERGVSEARKQALGVAGWAVWGKEVSRFAWFYDSSETCLLIEGEVTVHPAGAAPVMLKAGDVAHFPAGLACEWEVTAALKKHYRFG